MKEIVCDRTELAENLRILGRIAPRSSAIPAIQNIRLSANGKLELAATDLALGAVVRMAGNRMKGDATVAVPPARLMHALGTCQDPKVTLGFDGLSVSIDGGGVKIAGMDPADWPTLPEQKNLKPCSIFTTEELREAVREVKYAVSTEAVRYALTGVLFDADPKKGIHFIGCDGKVLAARKLAHATVTEQHRVILPLPFLDVALRLAAGEKTIDFAFAPENRENGWLVTRKGAVFSKLIEGNYPDWQCVFPQLDGYGWTFQRKELRDALRSVCTATTDKTRAVRFKIAGGKCTLYARTLDVGEATVEIAAQGNGEFLTVLNPEYVFDFLSSLPKGIEQVRLQGTTKSSAVLWTGHERLSFVQMPLTVNL